MMYIVEMASCELINLTSYMMMATDVQAMLRFCLSNYKDCNVGITD
jgi:hypothetical protein